MSDDWFRVRSVPTEKDARKTTEREEIETREGTVVAEPGDYVVREEDGNKYPISAEKLAAYYEEIDRDE